MKIQRLLLLLITCLVFTITLVGILLFSIPNTTIDTVKVNELLQQTTTYWDLLNQGTTPPITTDFSYTILNQDYLVLTTTDSTISQTINQAIASQDTILDIEINQQNVGKLIIENTTNKALANTKQSIFIILIISIIIQMLILSSYIIYLYRTIITPFNKLKQFSIRIASGDLDFPLEIDHQNIFGSFSEAFDLMRQELKKAHIQEQAANQSKKELVAKLSHDIKTPVASIKAISELMLTKADIPKSKQQLQTINYKADQIDNLISDLFNTTLQELQQLTVITKEYPSSYLKGMLKESDYQNKAIIQPIPLTLLRFDHLRLQQIFDNIISNSYKYANTNINITFTLETTYLNINIKDYGQGVTNQELPLLFEKFYQGQNAQGKSGAGLGLYISRYLLSQMQGEIQAINGVDGFSILISLPLANN